MKKIVTLMMAGVIASCTTPKIALDQNNWNNPIGFAVKGRQGFMLNQKLSFADYRTTEIKRSWTKESSNRIGWGVMKLPGDYTNIISAEYIQKKQTIRFALTDDQDSFSDVYCVSHMQSHDLVIGNNPNSIVNILAEIINIGRMREENNYYVQLYTNKSELPWEMLLDNNAVHLNADDYAGFLTQTKDLYYKIVPINRLAGKNGKPAALPLGSIGYEFRDKHDQPIAALSLIDNGMVYFRETDAATKFLLANACAALLLQEQI